MLAALLHLEELLSADAGTAFADLHRRDRAVGVAIDSDLGGSARVLAWAARRAGEDGAIADTGRALRALGWLLAVVGIAAGSAFAAGVLYFDGTARVNVLPAFVLLAGVPACTVFLTLAVMVPAGWRRRVPGHGLLAGLGALLSPGAWFGALARRLSPFARDRLALWSGQARAGHRVYGRLRAVVVLHASQIFALGFNLGVLGAFLSLVLFTDLAFGWSTTVDAAPADIHALASAAAAPWSGWLPEAVPSPDLVAATRYFRLEPAAVDDGVAASLGGWWPFLAMSVAVYGVIPRAFTFLLGAALLRSSIARTTRLVPGVEELLYRLDHEVIETRATDTETEGPPRGGAGWAPGQSAPSGRACAMVRWGTGEGIDASAAVCAATGLASEATFDAGGSASLEADAVAAREAAQPGRPVAVVVRSWEPPLAEFVDFLGDLRAALGDATAILVVPVAEPGTAAVEPEALEVWRRRLAATGDPWLTVCGPGVARPS